MAPARGGSKLHKDSQWFLVYAFRENEAARQTVFCQKTVLGVRGVSLFCGCCGGVNSLCFFSLRIVHQRASFLV